MTRAQLARAWHGATVVNGLVAIAIQVTLVVRGVGVLVEDDGTSAGTPERLLRFFSYFTIQSNILAVVTAALLIAQPDRGGRGWRAVRFAALLGMTTTLVVYVIALRPILDLHGLAWLTDVMFHYVAPALTVVGWAMFGPWGRIDPRVIATVICWPIAYFGYTQALGTVSGWYPYPFLDADEHGTGQVLVNATVVTMLVVALSGAFWALDRWLERRRTRDLVDEQH